VARLALGVVAGCMASSGPSSPWKILISGLERRLLFPYYCGLSVLHDGRWAMATLEVGNAIRPRAREIMLTHQCALADDLTADS